MQSEKEFQNAVVEYAHSQGWLVHHARAAQVREGKWVTPIQGDAGFPDLVMVRPVHSDYPRHRLVFAELKSEKGRVSVAQQRWQDALEPMAYGAPVSSRVWRPSDWDEIEATLGRRKG